MFDYKIFLPDFTKQEVSAAIAYMKKKDVDLEIAPTFNYYQTPPFEQFAQISFLANGLPKWPYKDEKIVSGFNIKVENFDLDRALKAEQKSITNLFGLVKNKKNTVRLKEGLAKTDKGVEIQLRSCKKEVTITEHAETFASYIAAPAFAVALTLSSKGLIYEGEFFSHSQVEQDFWPGKPELDSILEDVEDGEKPEIFTGWF